MRRYWSSEMISDANNDSYELKHCPFNDIKNDRCSLEKIETFPIVVVVDPVG